MSGIEFVQELLNGHPERIYNMFRLDKKVFIRLYCTLEHLHLLKHDRHVYIEAMAMAMCLYILSHGAIVQVLSERLQHSIAIMFTHFKLVLIVLYCSTKYIIKAKPQRETPQKLETIQTVFFFIC